MNWLSYQRIDVRAIEPGSLILLVGSQRQSIRDYMKAHELAIKHKIILDNVDYHASYMQTPTEDELHSQFHGAFVNNLANLPTKSLIVLDASLIPTSFHAQLQAVLEDRFSKEHTIFIIYGHTGTIPIWLANVVNYVFIHRMTCIDSAFRLFGKFFPDMHEFVYAIEQYGKYYEALVIDNTHKKAMWYRPQAYM